MKGYATNTLADDGIKHGKSLEYFIQARKSSKNTGDVKQAKKLTE